MHLFSPEIGLMGTSGIVGPCILQAAGVLIVAVAAIVSTILVFAVTFFIAGDAPVL